MNLEPKNQLKLFGLENEYNNLISIYNDHKLPNKILLSGQKGSGKCTLAYHLINYILSIDEDFSYDLKNMTINNENKSFKLTINQTNPNFYLIDVPEDKKSIDISLIRDLITKINKSSFNNKPRFVLIDNIEYLNNNSINALLKVLEEPNFNIYFILIHNNKKIYPTIKSRCLDFKISLSHKRSINIINELLNENIKDLLNKDLICHYFTPGDYYNLIKFSTEHNLDIKRSDLKMLLSLLITKGYYKKDISIKNLLYNMIEFFLSTQISLNNCNFYNFFLKKIYNTKLFNLDEEILLTEFNYKILNG